MHSNRRSSNFMWNRAREKELVKTELVNSNYSLKFSFNYSDPLFGNIDRMQIFALPIDLIHLFQGKRISNNINSVFGKVARFLYWMFRLKESKLLQFKSCKYERNNHRKIEIQFFRETEVCQFRENHICTYAPKLYSLIYPIMPCIRKDWGLWSRPNDKWPAVISQIFWHWPVQFLANSAQDVRRRRNRETSRNILFLRKYTINILAKFTA